MVTIENFHKRNKKNIKILFLDESISQENNFISVSGFFCKANDIYNIEDELKQIISNFKLNKLNSIKEKEFKNIRSIFYEKIELILEKYDVKLLAAIILTKRSCKVTSKNNGHFNSVEDSPFFDGCKLVSERFFFQLNCEDIGFIFYDTAEDKEFLVDVLKSTSPFHFKKKQYYTNIPNKIDGEQFKKKIYSFTFLDDEQSLSIQLADLICGLVRIAVDNFCKNDELQNVKKNIETLNNNFYALDKVWKLFPSGTNNKINGYGIKVW